MDVHVSFASISIAVDGARISFKFCSS